MSHVWCSGRSHRVASVAEEVGALACAYGNVDYPVGMRHGDHLCWIYDGRASWDTAVTAYLLDGVQRRERLLYLAATTQPDRLPGELSNLPGRDDLVASGQLMVMSVGEVVSADRPAGPDEQLDVFRRLIADAGRDGYDGLRMAADATSQVTADASRTMATELTFDALVSESPAVAMCGFDSNGTSRSAEDLLCFVHPLCHRSTLDTGVHLYADGVGGWCLTGGVDATSAGHLATALAVMPRDGDVHLRLGGLRFCDAAATRALVSAAATMHPAGRLVLHDAPPLLRRVLNIGWPGDNPGLVVLPGPSTATSVDLRSSRQAAGGSA